MTIEWSQHIISERASEQRCVSLSCDLVLLPEGFHHQANGSCCPLTPSELDSVITIASGELGRSIHKR